MSPPDSSCSPSIWLPTAQQWVFQMKSHKAYGWMIKKDLNEKCNPFAVIIKTIL